MDDDDYKTESEVEADSDHDDLDAEQELGEWLGQLESLKMDLDSDGTATVQRRNKTVVTPKMAMESFRFSFLNDENPDVNFDAILGELCELETQLNSTQSDLSKACSGATMSPGLSKDENRDSGNDLVQSELDALATEITESLGFHQSTTLRDLDYFRGNHPGNYPGDLAVFSDIGETDSAFSDNASLPSSESFTSMVTVSSSADTASNYTADTCSTGSNSTLTAFSVQQGEQERKARLQAEKIRIALEKIKDSKIQKLFVRAFANDGSSKSILVDEKMNIGQICAILADKNHVRLNPHLAVIEHLPELCMERILEDHDSLVENMVMWTRDSKNKILFEERAEKYDLLKCPEKYLLVGASSEKGASLDPKCRQDLIEEFYAGSGTRIPEVEGVLYLKSDGKKQWKKYLFVLRSSGLYYNPKGKISKSAKDLSCLIQFGFVDVYRGLSWKKKFHAPTDFCFALKHPQIQKKNAKFMRYLCAENKASLMQWLTGIRMAKHGKQLYLNFKKLQQEISMWDSREIRCSVSDSYENNEKIELNPGGNLQDSRLSIPEAGSRHSFVTVKTSTLVRNTSVDCDNPDELICLEVTPYLERKTSLTSQGTASPQRGPVKRVSFSNTHSIINADSCEEHVHLKHRDSITSASTDSSEDSSSSGEGRFSIGSAGTVSQRGKLRAKLPVTTETTRQISEMFQLSHDIDISGYDGSLAHERRSSLTSPIHVERDRRKSAPALHTPTEKDPPNLLYECTARDNYREQMTSQVPLSPIEKDPTRYTHKRGGSDSSQETWCTAAFDKDYNYEKSHYRKGSDVGDYRSIQQCVLTQSASAQVEKIVQRTSHERRVSDSGKDYRVVSQTEHYSMPHGSIFHMEKNTQQILNERDHRSCSLTSSSLSQSPSTQIENNCQKKSHERTGSDSSRELKNISLNRALPQQFSSEGYLKELSHETKIMDSVEQAEPINQMPQNMPLPSHQQYNNQLPGPVPEVHSHQQYNNQLPGPVPEVPSHQQYNNQLPGPVPEVPSHQQYNNQLPGPVPEVHSHQQYNNQLPGPVPEVPSHQQYNNQLPGPVPEVHSHQQYNNQLPGPVPEVPSHQQYNNQLPGLVPEVPSHQQYNTVGVVQLPSKEPDFPPPPVFPTDAVPPPPSQYQGPPGQSPMLSVYKNSSPLSSLPLRPVAQPSPSDSGAPSLPEQPKPQQYSQGQMPNMSDQRHIRRPLKSGCESPGETPSRGSVPVLQTTPCVGATIIVPPPAKPTKSIPPPMPFNENSMILISATGQNPRSAASSQPPRSPVSQSTAVNITHQQKVPVMSPGRPPPPPVPQQGHIPVISAKKPTHVRRASGGPVVTGGNGTRRSPSMSAEAEDTYTQSSLPFLAELSKRPHTQKGFPLIVASKNPPATMPKPEQACRGSAQTSHSMTNHDSVNAQSLNKSMSDTKRTAPPPPPKRNETTKLSSEPRTMNTHTQANAVSKACDPIYQNYEECDGIMDIHDLPPPPPELLEGYKSKEQLCFRKGKPPPPPPKRSKETQLSSQ